MMKMFVISNMYPSKKNPSYGIFIKKFVIALTPDSFTLSRLTAIYGKPIGKFNKLTSYLKFYIHIFNGILFSSYDFIYVHYISHSSLALLILDKFIKKPLLLNFHGGDLFPTNGIERFLQKYVEKVVRKAALIVVPSVFFKNIIVEKFNIEPKSVYVYPSSGIDINLFKPIVTKREENVFTIGFVSRIVTGKGWDILLKAISILISQGLESKIKVKIAGNGAQEDEFAIMIEELGLQHVIEYLGEVPNNELPELLNSFDVFVFSTQMEESLGLILLEAMACGTLAITSNHAAMATYIQDEENAFFFKKGSPERLAKTLLKVMNLSQERREEVKNNGLACARTFNQTSQNELFILKIKEILKDHADRNNRN